MAHNNYRRRDRLRRQYTFTKTKAAIGFILSAVFSITLSTYFENYGVALYQQVKGVLFGSTVEESSQLPQAYDPSGQSNSRASLNIVPGRYSDADAALRAYRNRDGSKSN